MGYDERVGARTDAKNIGVKIPSEKESVLRRERAM